MQIKVTEAIEPFEISLNDTPLFLAGGITGCPDWQKEAIERLRGFTADAEWTDSCIHILNPRRANFPIHDPKAADGQIEWEQKALCEADVISFWFCKETIQPIVLFELGRYVTLAEWHNECAYPPNFGPRANLPLRRKAVCIGIEPGYPRTRDVEMQMYLIDPALPIVRSLDALMTNTWNQCLGL